MGLTVIEFDALNVEKAARGRVDARPTQVCGKREPIFWSVAAAEMGTRQSARAACSEDCCTLLPWPTSMIPGTEEETGDRRDDSKFNDCGP